MGHKKEIHKRVDTTCCTTLCSITIQIYGFNNEQYVDIFMGMS